MIQRKAGYIVGEVDTSRFVFVSDTDNFPPKHEYLVIPDVKEREGIGTKQVDVLAQVSRISNRSDILGESLSLEELESIINRYTATTKVFGEAKILGYLNKRNEVIMPRSAAIPGQEVFIADSDLLSRFFTKDIKSGIAIGSLITRDEVKVALDPNGFRKHVAVIAQTGAGKSYLVGLVLENLLPLGATVIVLDPNSDYVMMRSARSGGKTVIADDVTVYRPPGLKGRRFSDEEIGGADPYTIDFSRLNAGQVCDVAGISSRWAVIREAVTDALGQLHGIYGPQQLIDALERIALNPATDSRKSKAAVSAVTYIRRLLNYKIWGSQDIPLDELVKPKRLSVIDLAGLQRNVSEYIVQKTLDDVWSLAVTGSLRFPIFIVIEEAHNFAPGASQTYRSGSSLNIIERIAAEGRKFGIFLMVVTQRPNKISSNVLSQCNSQIIMRLTNPEDMSAVKRASEGLSEDLFNDLPGLNKGEAVVVGELTKIPTMVKITGRISGEGGSDIDLEEALRKALDAYEIAKKTEPEESKVKEPKSRW
ncbi:MAG: ATP-binding protein [Candidatus Bathyarchaeota archaeon]|nr:ATP-binding protein [Candidatus Bathyarchaeota archaeon]